jgi:hypothetical protein
MNISNKVVAVSVVALICLTVAYNILSPTPFPTPNSAHPAAQRIALDLDKPLFLKEGSIACEDPRDLERLPFESEGFNHLDAGERYLSCLEWSARQVVILDRKGEMLDVVDANLTPEHRGGWDSWVLEDSLRN